MAYVQTYWRPEPLKARLRAALHPAAEDVKRAAQMRAKSRVTRAGMRVVVVGSTATVIAPGKQARFQEHGTSPHEEQPRKQAMKLKDGGFVRGPLEHPGSKAEPFLKPAAALFPELYRRRARAALL